jgi:ATP-dependent exoDNAse (exonuclease V) beta subunit
MATTTLAILVGGGPAPGINAVIAAATIEARNRGLVVLGCHDGYQWLMKKATSHVVLILNAHELDGSGDEEEARRLYIAMTRARDELCISAARPSRIVDEVARAVQAGAGP